MIILILSVILIITIIDVIVLFQIIKNKYITFFQFVTTGISCVVFLIGIMYFTYNYKTNKFIKKYIIKNKDKLTCLTSNNYEKDYFVIDKTDLIYYKEISIKKFPDSTFTIVCWGDRNSIMWDFLKDKRIDINIAYEKNNNLDIQIFNLLKNNTYE